MSQLLGEIRRFAGGGVFPDGWTACNGAVLPIDGHQPLFSLLGWRFGGDGWTTFRLPVLESRDGALHYGIALNGAYPTRHTPMPQDAYVGEIRLFGGEHAPAGWLPCDGRRLSISDWEELFHAIGTTWGGDAEEFALPDLQGEPGADVPAVKRLTYIIAAAGRRAETA